VKIGCTSAANDGAAPLQASGPAPVEDEEATLPLETVEGFVAALLLTSGLDPLDGELVWAGAPPSLLPLEPPLPAPPLPAPAPPSSPHAASRAEASIGTARRRDFMGEAPEKEGDDGTLHA